MEESRVVKCVSGDAIVPSERPLISPSTATGRISATPRSQRVENEKKIRYLVIIAEVICPTRDRVIMTSWAVVMRGGMVIVMAGGRVIMMTESWVIMVIGD